MHAVFRTLTLGLPLTLGAPSAALACTICLCTASLSTPVAFGNYNPVTASPTDIVGQIAFSCLIVNLSPTAGIAYDIRLSRGQAGTYASRQMAGPGGARLNYNLHTTAARSTVWGDGTGGSSFVSDSGTVRLIDGYVRNYSVFARLPPNQYVRGGAYTDTIVVTVTF